MHSTRVESLIIGIFIFKPILFIPIVISPSPRRRDHWTLVSLFHYLWNAYVARGNLLLGFSNDPIY